MHFLPTSRSFLALCGASVVASRRSPLGSSVHFRFPSFRTAVAYARKWRRFCRPSVYRSPRGGWVVSVPALSQGRG